MTWIDMRRVIAKLEHVPAASIQLVGYDKSKSISDASNKQKYNFDIDESYYETDAYKDMNYSDF